MPLPDGPHLDRLREALAAEAVGHRALLDGDDALGRGAMLEAARRYRASWEAAPPPGSYGRLIGMLKAAVIGGEPGGAAAYTAAAIPDDAASPAASYARAIAALAAGDDGRARAAAERMRGASP